MGGVETARPRPEPIERAAVLAAVKTRPAGVGACGAQGAAAGLDRRCARQRWFGAAGMKEAPLGPNQGRLRGRTKAFAFPFPFPPAVEKSGTGTGNDASVCT